MNRDVCMCCPLKANIHLLYGEDVMSLCVTHFRILISQSAN